MKIKYIIVFFLNINFVLANPPALNRVYEQKLPKDVYKELINKANMCSINKEYKKALYYADKAYRLNPRKKDALLILARIYNFKGDFKKLKLISRKIVEISPKDYLGNIYLANSCDKIEKKREILSKLLKIYPDDKRIKEKLKGLDV